MSTQPASDTDRLLMQSEAARPPSEWSLAAIRLLQGVVYYDDNAKTWDLILRFQTPLREYFSKIGLYLIVDEPDGMAYLRQSNDESDVGEFDSLPRLFRRTPLGYETSLLAVLLRDLLRQFEEEDLQNQRCVVSQRDLLDLWRAFFAHQSDEVKLNRTLQSSLRKLEDLKFVKQFEDEPPTWEVRRILKARLPISELESLKAALIARATKDIPHEDSNAADHDESR